MVSSPSLYERMLGVNVAGQNYALPARFVREVARLPELSRVPNAPAGILGLANLHGSVIPVVSAATLLSKEASEPTRMVIVEAGELIGLAVDSASQIFAGEELRQTPTIDVLALVANILPADSKPSMRGVAGGIVSAVEVGTHVENDAVRLIAFSIGSQEFALPVATVDEVLALPVDIALMPDGNEVTIGSAAVRGEVIPLLSLQALLALPPGLRSPRPRVVVVKIGKHRIGLVVDELRSVLTVEAALIDAIPQALNRGKAEARIQSICRLDDGRRLISVLAAEHLLRDDITSRLLQRASMKENLMTESAVIVATEQFLLFRVGMEEFALPIDAVEEVAQLPAKLTRLPKAPAFVQGVMNVRGQVIPVIDQAQRFGTATPDHSRRRVIVVKLGDLTAGFIVDAVSEVVRVPAAALQPAPDLGNNETRVFERVANLTDTKRIILIVNARELLGRAEQDLLRSFRAKDAVSAP